MLDKKLEHCLEVLENEKDIERAKSILLELINHDNSCDAWLILSLIYLREKKYTVFSTCLRHVLEKEDLNLILLAVINYAWRMTGYLETTFSLVESLLEGFLRENPILKTYSKEERKFIREHIDIRDTDNDVEMTTLYEEELREPTDPHSELCGRSENIDRETMVGPNKPGKYPDRIYHHTWGPVTKKLRKLMKNNPALPVVVSSHLSVTDSNPDCSVVYVHDSETRAFREKIILIHNKQDRYPDTIKDGTDTLPFS